MDQKLTDAQIQTAILSRITFKNKEGPLENAISHFVSLSKLLLSENEDNFEEKFEEYQLSFENEMDLYKLQIEKDMLLSRAEEIDIDNIEKLSREYEEEIQRVKLEIEQLKSQLEQEQKEKENKEKLIALAKLIATHPSRRETESAIAEVQNELDITEEESTRIVAEFEMRSKQFQLVVHGLDLLKQEFDRKSFKQI